MSGEDEAEYTNPYRAAIVSARDLSADDLDAVADELVTARGHLDDGAWQSTAADTFYAELSEQIRQARGAADAVLAEFDDAIAEQPEDVGENDWQRRWRNL